MGTAEEPMPSTSPTGSTGPPPRAARRAERRTRLRRRRWAASGALGVLAVSLLAAVLGPGAPEDDVVVAGGPERPTVDGVSAVRVLDAPAPGASAAAPAAAAPSPSVTAAAPVVAAVPGLPESSGEGHRIVFDLSDQRVWLVDEAGAVARTYLVSGSRYDQLDPGSYAVYSKSEQTTSYTLTETMRYMVRFTKGERAAIGFHDIPVSKQTGQPVQTDAELGQRLSDGCVRQNPADAEALWQFAPVGTPVVVTA